jgi:hypothetical protein
VCLFSDYWLRRVVLSVFRELRGVSVRGAGGLKGISELRCIGEIA